jgi:hypothetical protein
MEPFFDGGLFEILFAGLFTTIMNYVFSKRVLLVIFSVLTVATPVLLFFIRTGEAFNCLVMLCLFNAIFLVVLLWKAKYERPVGPLLPFSYKQFLRKYPLRRTIKRYTSLFTKF